MLPPSSLFPAPRSSSVQSPAAFGYFPHYLNQDAVRRAIHVGNLSFGSQSEAVELALINVSSSAAVVYGVLYMYSMWDA